MKQKTWRELLGKPTDYNFTEVERLGKYWAISASQDALNWKVLWKFEYESTAKLAYQSWLDEG